MIYCTVDDLRLALDAAYLSQLSDDAGGLLESDEVMAWAIQAGSDEVEGYVRLVIELPLDPVPSLLKTLATRVAIYYLYSRRNREEAKREDYRDALKTLEMIRAGKIPLEVPEADADADADGVATGGLGWEAI